MKWQISSCFFSKLDNFVTFVFYMVEQLAFSADNSNRIWIFQSLNHVEVNLKQGSRVSFILYQVPLKRKFPHKICFTEKKRYVNKFKIPVFYTP